MPARVAIVDYGLCNLDSVARAVEECGGSSRITDEAGDLAAADKIIVPGVGAFPAAMKNLDDRGLSEVIRGIETSTSDIGKIVRIIEEIAD